MIEHEGRESRTRRSGWARSGAVVAAATLALGAAACGDDSDGDNTSDTEPAVDEAVGDATSDDALTEDTTAETGSGDAMTDDSMSEDTGEDDTATSVDAVAAEVLTDTLAGEGVDLFLALVPLVGLDEITDADEITVFVPSDEAFQSIAADEVAAIVDDPMLVRDVLESHVAEGAYRSSDLEDGDTISPISGEELTVSIDGDAVMIGDATVVRADIEFDGGVIHIIDDVLVLPEA
jgi:uncharacterized surface protein with fasciclin (FAS1) repeats